MELAGRKVRLDEMSVEQAKRIFSFYGADPHAEDIRKEYLKLVRDHHTDRGGSKEAIQDINSAYELLKGMLKAGEIRRHPNSAFEDFRDPEYFRRRVREVSGKGAEPMTLWAYDGHKFSRFEVEGSAAAVTIMVEGMLTQFGHGTIAVLVSKQSSPRRLTCLWASGKTITPTAFDAVGFGPPTTDRNVLASLNRFLGVRKAA